MYSVIIPTMWKCDRLHETLFELNNHPSVGEIILIDNSSIEHALPKLEKLIYILEEKNTFVNPAWNKGVSLSKYDKLLILNDDTWFDWNVMIPLSQFVTEQFGCIGMCEANYTIEDTQTELELVPINHRIGGFGTAFFIHKSNWIPIPDTMKIFCGDDWLFVTNRNSVKQNLMISNFKVNGYISATTTELSKNEEIEEILKRDLELKEIYRLF
jgi:hypothetical protein